jgi:hypothetical protein
MFRETHQSSRSRDKVLGQALLNDRIAPQGGLAQQPSVLDGCDLLPAPENNYKITFSI